MSLELYTYFRSSCSYRVRIAFGVKGLAYKPTFVHLVNNGGEQHKDSYKKLNPISEVPYLKLEDGRGFAQSVAIIEYLEEVQPQPALLPKDPYGRARVRQMAEIVNSSIQPLQNLSVTKELTARYGSSETQNQQWVQHWMSRGFSALESVMRETAGRYSYGDTITMADCFLVPQVGAAERFKVPIDGYPTIARVASECRKVSAFISADPFHQPDTPEELKA